jgi:hypothetical protein
MYMDIIHEPTAKKEKNSAIQTSDDLKKNC